MELADEITINAPKDRVYAALNDPEILQQCIPGCEELIKHSDTELEAKVVLKVGPVKARFSGDVQLDTAGAPDEFSLTGQGNGGAAGHAKGGAHVTLTADGPDTTILRYEAKAAIGKLSGWLTLWVDRRERHQKGGGASAIPAVSRCHLIARPAPKHCAQSGCETA